MTKLRRLRCGEDVHHLERWDKEPLILDFLKSRSEFKISNRPKRLHKRDRKKNLLQKMRRGGGMHERLKSKG